MPAHLRFWLGVGVVSDGFQGTRYLPIRNLTMDAPLLPRLAGGAAFTLALAEHIGFMHTPRVAHEARAVERPAPIAPSTVGRGWLGHSYCGSAFEHFPSWHQHSLIIPGSQGQSSQSGGHLHLFIALFLTSLRRTLGVMGDRALREREYFTFG